MSLKASNPRLNATLAQGHEVIAKLTAQGLSRNPRLYANPEGLQSGGLIPEISTQDNSDLPDWAKTGTGDLSGHPDDELLYLQVWVAESDGGAGNFHNVADIIRYTSQGLMTLKQAVGL